MGTERLMSSGVASRCALYCGKASFLKVSPWSKATPMCDGCSLLSTSLRVLQKPITAEVLSPFELMRGLLIKA